MNRDHATTLQLGQQSETPSQRKGAEYKIDIQILVAFLYTNNKLSKKENNSHSQWYQEEYLGINSTKEVKDLYTENCKTLVKVIKADTNKWEDI